MIEQIQNINNLDELAELYTATFGKNGTMTARLKSMRDLDNSARAELNAENTQLRAAFKTRQLELEDAALVADLERGKTDATAPNPNTKSESDVGHIHPLIFATAEISRILSGMGYERRAGPEVEDDWHNFTALNTPLDHPAREMQDTFFLANGNVMRTQTSAVQIRSMEENGAPIKIFCPGATYRRDMDATHSPMFHQVEGLYIGKSVTLTDLLSDIKTFLEAFFVRSFNMRTRPSYFPFTEPSVEVDVEWTPGKWMEMGGAGMVHPNVLKNCNIDTEKFGGFAFGFGIDRLAMLKYGLNDIRKFYDGDVRWIIANGTGVE